MITVTRTDMPPLDEYVKLLKGVWQRRWLTNDGRLVRELEEKLREYTGAKNMLAVSNGTLAIELAIRALGLAGRIITTPFSFAATINAAIWGGLEPVFADIDPETFNIDPGDVERKITEKTRAILAVHVYGNPCDTDRLQQIADAHNLKIIYDAAHAFGVQHQGRSILDFGDVSTLSFHATKVFSTGEGGGVAVADEALLTTLKLMRNHGIQSEKAVVLPGTNAKMSELHAALGLCNLKRVDENIRRRQRIYEYYVTHLGDAVAKFQKITASRYNYSYMPVCFADNRTRDRVYDGLIGQQIWPRKYFYPLMADFPFVARRPASSDLPNARDVAERVLCLPMYPDLDMTAVERIVRAVKELAR